MTTGWVYHELYMWHDTGRAAPVTADRRWLQAWEHYENPETKRRFRNLVEVAGLFDDLVPIAPRMATIDEILRFHTRAYVESIRAMSASTGGNAGENAVGEVRAMKEAVPHLFRVAALWDSTTPPYQLNALKMGAKALALTLQTLEVRGSEDLESAFVTAAKDHAHDPRPQKAAGPLCLAPAGGRRAGPASECGVVSRWREPGPR